MTVPLNKRDIEALIATADAEIAKIKLSPTLTIEESHVRFMDLQKLEATRHSLVRDLAAMRIVI
jgi:hypothetical protein